MYKFKINKAVKRELAREVKENFSKNDDYSELAIFYNAEKEKFFVANTIQIDRLVYEGHCFYSLFKYYNGDKVTLEEIENKIFNQNK